MCFNYITTICLTCTNTAIIGSCKEIEFYYYQGETGIQNKGQKYLYTHLEDLEKNFLAIQMAIHLYLITYILVPIQIVVFDQLLLPYFSYNLLANSFLKVHSFQYVCKEKNSL